MVVSTIVMAFCLVCGHECFSDGRATLKVCVGGGGGGGEGKLTSDSKCVYVCVCVCVGGGGLETPFLSNSLQFSKSVYTLLSEGYR